AVLDWLDAAGIEADELSVHTPDLDDVFFALTAGGPTPARSLDNARPTDPARPTTHAGTDKETAR
ncbi:hypothetical protein AB0M07_32445, partial [Streptomyces sp. NPDC052015]